MSYETEPELQARLENRALATQLEADERQKAQVEQLVSEAQTDLMRKLAAKDAIAALEEERARRITEAALAQAQEQLVRNANVQKAIALEEEEQRRRASEMSGSQAPDGGLAERKAIAERVEGLADAERARRLSAGDEFELRPQKRQLEESLVQKVAERRASRTSATDLPGSAAAAAAGATNGGSYSYSSGSAQTDANVPRSVAEGDRQQKDEPSGIRAALAKAASVITGHT
ncbi:hypothetical protein HDU89_003247 [Geranomyces variabilis]|nr:hypothetical protein HDU89_003247 [Geranomyces variabilis]